MATFFRFRIPLGVGWRRRKYAPPGAPAIRAAVFSMAGASTVPGSTLAIFSAALASSGIGASATVGAGIKSGVLASAGVGTASYAGQPFFVAAFSMAGAAVAAFAKGLGQVTSTNIIQKPVDCVMAGDQKEFKSGRAHRRALRGIFRE